LLKSSGVSFIRHPVSYYSKEGSLITIILAASQVKGPFYSSED